MQNDEWPCELCTEVYDTPADALTCALADYQDALNGWEWLAAAA